MRIGVLCCRTGKPLTDEEALQCARGNTPDGLPCALPYEMMAGCLDETGRETAHLSVTMLGGCRRQQKLKIEKPYRTYPIKMFPAQRGTLGHYAVERHCEPGYLCEMRFEMTISGFPRPFTGQIDKLGITKKRITDWKTKGETKLPTEPEQDHVMQLNCYRYLVKYGWPQKSFTLRTKRGEWNYVPGIPAGIEIDTLDIIYWSMARVLPAMPVPLLAESDVYDYIVEGLTELRSEELPPVPETLDPFGHPFCTQHCPVVHECLEELVKIR